LFRFRFILATIIIVLIAIFATGCGGEEQDFAKTKEDTFKVGFVYRTSPGKSSYDNSHEQGRKYLEAQLPNIETIVMENISGDYADYAVYQLAQKSCQVVITTDYSHIKGVYKVLNKYPGSVKVLNCSTNRDSDSVVKFYWGHMYQAGYLLGIVAGEMTESNLIGFVASYPDAETICNINAFTLGVRSVNPEAFVKIAWTKERYDPPQEKEIIKKERDAANALMDSGADIIVQYEETSAPIEAAAKRGKYAMGYYSDVSVIAPDSVLTSAIWNWGPYYVKTINSIQEGKWEPDAYLGNLSDNIVSLASYGPMVPEKVKVKVQDAREKIISGEWEVFTGPIKDQLGKVMVPANKVLNEDDIRTFNWFVEGVIGSRER
jgi:basic membrane protein A